MAEINSSTDVTEQIGLAAEYDRKGDHTAAEATLRSIDRAALEREYEESALRVPKEIRPVRTIDAASRAASNSSVENQLAMFGRDRFICRYCGKKTIFVPTLRALSLLHPDAFPYHTNWDLKKCHIIYWTHSAVCGHLEPISRGGTSEPNNIVTTCALCTFRKGNARPEEIGWELRPIPTKGYWDGTSTLFVRLCSASPAIQHSGELRKWYDAILKP